jgi:hypothetical protein
MDRAELIALLNQHRMNHTWCDGCKKNVSKDHIADVLMPDGVDYLLQGRWID